MPRYKSQLGHPCLSSNQTKPNHLSSIFAIKEKDRKKEKLEENGELGQFMCACSRDFFFDDDLHDERPVVRR